MFLLEYRRALEADRQREMRQALRRGAFLAARSDADSRIDSVALGDGAGRGGDSRTDLGRSQDFDPAPGAEQGARRFVRPIQTQPKA